METPKRGPGRPRIYAKRVLVRFNAEETDLLRWRKACGPLRGFSRWLAETLNKATR